LRQFTDRGRKVASFDEALTSLVPVEKNLTQLMMVMDNIAQFWLEIELSLWDIEERAKELRHDTVHEMSVQGLKRDWIGVAKEYRAYYSCVCILHL
jgi:hypothetical protein